MTKKELADTVANLLDSRGHFLKPKLHVLANLEITDGRRHIVVRSGRKTYSLEIHDAKWEKL